MKIFFFLCLFLTLILKTYAETNYYGPRSTEALLKFTARIQLKLETPLKQDQLKSAPVEVNKAVTDQLAYLIGHLQSGSFIASYQYPGVIGKKYEVELLDVTAPENGKQFLTYRFEGKVNFHSSVFSTSNVRYVPLKMPLNPYDIYAHAFVKGKNECVSEESTPTSFFYFWDTEKENCPLKGDKELVLHLTGKLEQKSNTVMTWPEYDQLYARPELNIAVFFGYINEIDFTRINPEDEGFLSYQNFKKNMLAQDFVILKEKTAAPGIALSILFEKTIINQFGLTQKIKVNVLLSDTAWASPDRTFAAAYQDALENAQIVTYDGHSGLGKNLSLINFPATQWNNDYQLFYFNGCSSYAYYTDMYFVAKPGGTRNLDIISTGLPTPTSTSAPNMMAFLQPFLDGKIESFQSLLVGMENSNRGETYLSGVNGDEDNVFRP